jgi:hypothetical protein
MANIKDFIYRIYNFNCRRANVYKLKMFLARVKLCYSDELTGMLQQTLVFDKSHRIDMDQLIDTLIPVFEIEMEQCKIVFKVIYSLNVSSPDLSNIHNKMQQTSPRINLQMAIHSQLRPCL